MHGYEKGVGATQPFNSHRSKTLHTQPRELILTAALHEYVGALLTINN